MARAIVASSSIALMVLASACAPRASAPTLPVQPPSQELVTRAPTDVVKLAGRTFLITPLEAKLKGRLVHSLQIAGDGMIATWSASSPPFTHSIQGDSISYGGHRLDATAVPSQFLLDQQPIELPAGGMYVLADGSYEFQFR